MWVLPGITTAVQPCRIRNDAWIESTHNSRELAGSAVPKVETRQVHASSRISAPEIRLLIVVSVLILAAVFVSSRVQTPPLLHSIALFGHLAALIVGFGSVVGVDYFGLLWFLRRISLETMLLQADRMSPLIWLGLGGLIIDRVLDGAAARSTVDIDQDGLCRRSRDSRRPGVVDQANDDAADAES